MLANLIWHPSHLKTEPMGTTRNREPGTRNSDIGNCSQSNLSKETVDTETTIQNGAGEC